ncbi:hypothetical protein [Yinghuangia seranimata]|uniref:hypothetical protein n=1 Tax=Yinghuangia seranimata TaxID=408067 RepID=UPI00248A9244|nr:hypothetical protein [Yinghuangia seranimata]MDI2131321.1 hypothetical protein [Yinghuangia seranimata]
MSEECELFYAYPDSLEGLLQRGRGLGAVRAKQDPVAATPFVYDSIQRDWTWDFPDVRAVYLARLVRDLELPLTPVVEQLSVSEDANARAADVLVLLAVDGSDEARDVLRTHVRDGAHWICVLTSMANRWPDAWWDDLGDVARTRIRDEPELPLRNPVWTRFGIDVRQSEPRPARRDLTGHPDGALYDLLASARPKDRARVDALRELRRRDSLGALIPLVPSLVTPDDDSLLPEIRRAVEHLGAAAVPAARGWAHDAAPWLARLGTDVLADQLQPEAVPFLVADLARLLRTRTWCGPDSSARRLARFGPAASDAVPYLRRFWWRTPHSYERAAYLQALAAIDPTGLEYAYTESLWDCEDNARVLGVAHAPDNATTRARITELRDDPMETFAVWAAARS